MDCEVCGKRIIGKPYRVSIEGVVVSACERCSSLGYRLREVDRAAAAGELFDMPELVEEYPKLIRQARERLGLRQEELARRLLERASVVKKLEAGDLRPDERLIRKLQRVLNVRLTE